VKIKTMAQWVEDLPEIATILTRFDVAVGVRHLRGPRLRRGDHRLPADFAGTLCRYGWAPHRKFTAAAHQHAVRITQTSTGNARVQPARTSRDPDGAVGHSA
jgi:hypothetical protein